MSKRSSGCEQILFFNPALLNDFLHGRLGAAAIHVCQSTEGMNGGREQ